VERGTARREDDRARGGGAGGRRGAMVIAVGVVGDRDWSGLVVGGIGFGSFDRKERMAWHGGWMGGPAGGRKRKVAVAGWNGQ